MLASSKSDTDIDSLLHGYQLCATTEGKSPNSLAIVTRSVTYLYDFLSSNDLSTDVTQTGFMGMRAFILYLHQKRCFSNHSYSKAKLRGLSGHTINTYMRSIRAFWSWLAEEEIVESNPFAKLKIPKPPKKFIAAFSQHQIDLLLSVMGGSAESYRDVVIGLTLLDTGLRVNELINLRMEDVWLEEGLIKILGKGPEQMKAKADLRDKIGVICLEFPRYGYRRVTHHLKYEGCQVDHKKVLRLMRESDLLCHVQRKWVKTTDSKHRFPRYPNLIKEMVISRLNQVWLSGITYIRIRTGLVYLAAILDAYSRWVIGYVISTGLDTVRALEALRMAIAERQPGPGIIHHSDRGVQYASSEYIDELKSHGFEISMARKGIPYESDD